MAFADPDTFDYFRRGEPSRSLYGTQPTSIFDSFRRAQPPVSLLFVAGGTDLFTVVNGTQSQLVNVNAGGTDVDALTLKASVLLTQAEAAALASTAGVFVTGDTSPQQARLIPKRVIRYAST